MRHSTHRLIAIAGLVLLPGCLPALDYLPNGGPITECDQVGIMAANVMGLRQAGLKQSDVDLVVTIETPTAALYRTMVPEAWAEPVVMEKLTASEVKLAFGQRYAKRCRALLQSAKNS